MQFTNVLTIVAIAVGSASAAAMSPDGCVKIDGVKFCTTDTSAPSIAASPDGCVNIDGVKFCTVQTLKVRAIADTTVGTSSSEPTSDCVSIDGVLFCTNCIPGM